MIKAKKTEAGTKFSLTNDWKDEDQRIFTVKSVEIPANKITCLIGCNGIGKTTAIEEMKQFLQNAGAKDVKDLQEFNPMAGLFESLKNEKPKKPTAYIVFFDKDSSFVKNQRKGLDSWCFEHDMGGFLGNFSSNGESVIRRLNGAIEAIEMFTKKAVQEQVPLWIFIDDVDAGTSIDVIAKVKANLIEADNYLNKHNLEHYIIVTSNSFEFARDMYCLYARNMKQVTVSDYEEYKKFVLKSRKDKEKRDGIHTDEK